MDERTAVACMRFALRHGRELFLAGAYGLQVPGAGGYAVLAFVTTAAIGVGTVLGNHLGGAAQRRWAPASRGSSAARPG
ncbi:hypothetical protein [Streptomyces bacillaris]|uniref:hypothetical protein n=1 Tax=Streptomyces bacillaris TaxID=68179 RepID=UPI0037033FA8